MSTKTVAKVVPDYLVETPKIQRGQCKIIYFEIHFPYPPPKVLLEFDQQLKPVIVAVGDSS